MMNNKSTRNLFSFSCVFFLLMGLHSRANTFETTLPYFQDPITVDLSAEWQEYSFSDGVLIEYRMKTINSRDYGREVNMLVFRFTNTTDQLKDCSWIVKIERDGKCTNCHDLDSQEQFNRLELSPNEIIEGDASNLITRSELNIFGNFVKLVPGMSDQKLTGFELTKLTIK